MMYLRCFGIHKQVVQWECGCVPFRSVTVAASHTRLKSAKSQQTESIDSHMPHDRQRRKFKPRYNFGLSRGEEKALRQRLLRVSDLLWHEVFVQFL